MTAHPTRYCGSDDLHFITASRCHRQPFLGVVRALAGSFPFYRHGEPGRVTLSDIDVLRAKIRAVA